MDHLDELEAESIYIFREAYAKLKNVGIRWSIGKDSNFVLWLAKKAFFGHVPFLVLFIDTEKEFLQVYEFRDQRIKDWGLNYVQEQCPPVEEMDPTLPPAARLAARKTYGLKRALEKHGYNGPVAGNMLVAGTIEAAPGETKKREFGWLQLQAVASAAGAHLERFITANVDEGAEPDRTGHGGPAPRSHQKLAAAAPWPSCPPRRPSNHPTRRDNYVDSHHIRSRVHDPRATRHHTLPVTALPRALLRLWDQDGVRGDAAVGHRPFPSRSRPRGFRDSGTVRVSGSR